jgi:hypothetical protein
MNVPPRSLILRRPSACAPRVTKPDMPSSTPLERMCAALNLGRRGRELMRRVEAGRRARAVITAAPGEETKAEGGDEPT